MIHSNKRPFVCDICEKTFTSNSDLKRHKMIYTFKGPFVRDRYFMRNRDLKQHKIIHINIKQHDL